MQSKSLPTYTWSDKTQFGRGLGIKPRSPEMDLSEKEMCDYYPTMKGSIIFGTFPLIYGALCPECGEVTGRKFEIIGPDVDKSSHSLIHTHGQLCQTTFKVRFKEEDWDSAVCHLRTQENFRDEMLDELERAKEYDRLARAAHKPTVVAKQFDILAKAVNAQELCSPYPERSLRKIHEALRVAISIKDGFNPLETFSGVIFDPTPKPLFEYIEGTHGPFKKANLAEHTSSNSIRESIRTSLIGKYESVQLSEEESPREYWRFVWQNMQAFEEWADDRFGRQSNDDIPDYLDILKKAGECSSNSISGLEDCQRDQFRRALDMLAEDYLIAEKEMAQQTEVTV